MPEDVEEDGIAFFRPHLRTPFLPSVKTRVVTIGVSGAIIAYESNAAGFHHVSQNGKPDILGKAHWVHESL